MWLKFWELTKCNWMKMLVLLLMMLMCILLYPMTMVRHQDTEMLRPKNYQSSSNRDKPSNAIIERDKLRQETVIEIDPSSPTEKMFI
jgi:hypothetical protein